MEAPNTDTPICNAMKAGGNWNEDWNTFFDRDPQWTELFMNMATKPVREGILDPKTYEFLAIAVDASCTHMYGPGVRRHIRKALALGATPEEIHAVLQCVSVLGIHSLSLGSPILEEEIANLRDANPAGQGE